MTSQPRSGAQGGGGGGGGGGEGGYIKRVTGDEREDEMDKNLQLVGEREEGMAVKITHTHTCNNWALEWHICTYYIEEKCTKYTQHVVKCMWDVKATCITIVQRNIWSSKTMPAAHTQTNLTSHFLWWLSFISANTLSPLKLKVIAIPMSLV